MLKSHLMARGPQCSASPNAAKQIDDIDDPTSLRSSGRPRLLLLAPRFPYPALSGGKVLLLHLAKALRNYDITLLSICGSREEMDFVPSDGLFSSIHKVYLPKWQSIKNVISALPGRTPLQLAYYRSDAFRQKVEELLPHHDIVIAHLIRTGQYLTALDRTVPRVLLMSDAISLAYQRMTALEGAPRLWHFLYRAELGRLLSYEQQCPALFDQTWLHSDIDRRFLNLDERATRIIPNGVDLDEFPFNPAPSGNTIAFVGNMSFSLNVDACNYFLREIFPRLRSEANLKFRVIGACPPSVKKQMQKHPGVQVTGTVRRIADAVDDVFCGVCPVRGGAGMQTKILNYLALGLPCVTSEVGLGWIDARPGSDLLVYRQPDHASELILKLHADAHLRYGLAANGRQIVEREYDWKIVYRAIRSEISEFVAEDRPQSMAG